MFARRFATVVACLKILFGAVELATGLIWLFVTPSGVQHQIQRLVDWMASQQPDNPAVEMLQRQLPTLFAHGTLVALGLILLGSVKLAGAARRSSPGGRGATGCSSPAWSRCSRSTCGRPRPTARPSPGCSSASTSSILAALLWFRRAFTGRGRARSSCRWRRRPASPAAASTRRRRRRAA